MARRPKKVEAGAPLWVVTYGDMMTLLLCFFILLSAFANFEDPGSKSNAMAAIESIQSALGISSPAANRLDTVVEMNAVLEQILRKIKIYDQHHKGDSQDKGIVGRTVRIRRIRDGLEIVIGGPVVFEPFSATLAAQGREAVAAIGDELKGHRNTIEIRGHAADDGRPSDWTREDAMKLSFDRAQAVANELILRGLDPRTVRLVAVGDNEPVAMEVYDPTKRGMNRRVEIIIRESQINDYVGQEPTGAPATTQPG